MVGSWLLIGGLLNEPMDSLCSPILGIRFGFKQSLKEYVDR